MGVGQNLVRWWQRVNEPQRDMTLSDYPSFLYNGLQYPLQLQQTITGNEEKIERSFSGYVAGAFKSNPVVFACMAARYRLFSEARFQFRQMKNGRPGDLFGTSALSILEKPWNGGTTGDLLTRAIQDADLAGNFFVTRVGTELVRLRPDWVTIMCGSPSDSDSYNELDFELLGYVYKPGGPASGEEPVFLMPDQVAHFAPNPDPIARYRGMSWLTPLMRDIQADSITTSHKQRFFENGASPNMIVKLDASISEEAFQTWVKIFKENHEGAANAYKTLFLGGGADATVVGSNFKEIDFKAVQGAGETRVAAAAGIPPVLVGLSEGLDAATYSNYAQARRSFADGTLRPMWRNICGSLANIIQVPGGSDLWYDDRDIPFLQEDQKDLAEIQQTKSQAIKALTEAGYDAGSVVDAIESDDFSRLQHTNLFSVQLQPANSPQPKPQLPAPNGNGNGNGNSLASRRMLEEIQRHNKASEKATQQLTLAIASQERNLVVNANTERGAIENHHTIEAAKPAEVTTNINEGAIQSHTTNEGAKVDARTTVAKGAVQSYTTNEGALIDARTNVEEGAVQNKVDIKPPPPAKVDVDARTTVEEGAVQSHTTNEGAQVDARTTVEKGAVESNVNMEAPPPAEVDARTDVHVDKGAIDLDVHIPKDKKTKRKVTFSDGSEAKIEETDTDERQSE